MSEALFFPESECARALEMLPAFLDADLSAEQSEWLHQHIRGCAKCRTAQIALVGMDRELIEWGQRLGRQNPEPPGAREQLAARLESRPVRGSAVRWLPAAATAAAAALVIASIIPQRQHSVEDRAPTAFVGIPFVPPLDPQENTAIIRMDLPVATLIAVGYRVAADPEAIVSADVLVGEDGRAHAVRVSDIVLKAKGD